MKVSGQKKPFFLLICDGKEEWYKHKDCLKHREQQVDNKSELIDINIFLCILYCNP